MDSSEYLGVFGNEFGILEMLPLFAIVTAGMSLYANLNRLQVGIISWSIFGVILSDI